MSHLILLPARPDLTRLVPAVVLSPLKLGEKNAFHSVHANARPCPSSESASNGAFGRSCRNFSQSKSINKVGYHAHARPFGGDRAKSPPPFPFPLVDLGVSIAYSFSPERLDTLRANRILNTLQLKARHVGERTHHPLAAQLPFPRAADSSVVADLLSSEGQSTFHTGPGPHNMVSFELKLRAGKDPSTPREERLRLLEGVLRSGGANRRKASPWTQLFAC